MTYEYEYTDTFGGEANYTWVRRGTVEAKSDRHAITLVKRSIGVSRCKRETLGETIVLIPTGSATIIFIDQVV